MTQRERHLKGRVDLGALVGHWQDSSHLSNAQFAALCDWASGGDGSIHKSTVSHLRNRNYARGASLPVLETLAAANDAAHKWATTSHDAVIATLGPPEPHGITAAALNGTIWLPKLDEPTLPLSLCEFVRVAVGQLDLPYVRLTLAGDESERLSTELVDLLWSLVADVPGRDALTRIVSAVPDSPGTRAAVTALLTGATWDRDELQGRLPELAAAVGQLQQGDPAAISPSDLLARLSAGRRRT